MKDFPRELHGRPRHAPHWYFIEYGECPLCGASKERRERRYGPRPEKWEDRHRWLPETLAYDYCDVVY